MKPTNKELQEALVHYIKFHQEFFRSEEQDLVEQAAERIGKIDDKPSITQWLDSLDVGNILEYYMDENYDGPEDCRVITEYKIQIRRDIKWLLARLKTLAEGK